MGGDLCVCLSGFWVRLILWENGYASRNAHVTYYGSLGNYSGCENIVCELLRIVNKGIRLKELVCSQICYYY